jgi:hypothetical protein
MTGSPDGQTASRSVMEKVRENARSVAVLLACSVGPARVDGRPKDRYAHTGGGTRRLASWHTGVTVPHVGKACWSRTAISFSSRGAGSGSSILKRRAPVEVE